MNARFTIILAAGQGTRMKSHLYKVLHPVCGRAMVDHMLTQVELTHPDKIVTIVGNGAQAVETMLQQRTEYAVQAEQLGTGHAVLQAESVLGSATGMTLVVSGDTPLFTADTLNRLYDYHEQQHNAATVLTAPAPDPTGYGRLIRNAAGEVERIVEQKDATLDEQNVHEINTGVYCFDNQWLFKALHQVTNDNAQQEYYLTDVIAILKQAGQRVGAYQMADFEESMGVNDRVALAAATKVMQQRINRGHLLNGVTLIDPEHTTIDCTVSIGADTVIEPGVVLKGQTKIGSACTVTAGSRLVDSIIHNHVTVTSSTLEQAEMMAGSNIGPNSHLRPQAIIGEQVHIGNFCEVKQATIGARTKLGHLSYVGDATLGTDINIGCGVVFVNYDGVHKFHTEVGDCAFIGSNSNIVAPVKIADHSFIAAGSTITQDVAYHDMAIARARQTNKENYWDRLPLSDSSDWQ